MYEWKATGRVYRVSEQEKGFVAEVEDTQPGQRTGKSVFIPFGYEFGCGGVTAQAGMDLEAPNTCGCEAGFELATSALWGFDGPPLQVLDPGIVV